jgi:hypothetical protein
VRLEAIQRPINVPAFWKSSSASLEEEAHVVPNRRRGPHDLEKTQRFMAERMKATIRTADADHIPSVTMPKPVIDIVLEAATSTLAE